MPTSTTGTTSTIAHTIAAEGSETASFDRLAGFAAFVAGAAGLLYSVAFVLLKDQLLYSICLLVGGLASSIVAVALYRHTRSVDGGLSHWALLLGVVAAAGSIVHAGYDLSNAINPPAAANADLPSQVDPRGLLTFGVTGLSLFAFSWLITRGKSLPRSLGYLGYALAALLVFIYLGRLIVLDAKSLLILVPAALAGFVLNPAFYLWLGSALVRSPKAES